MSPPATTGVLFSAGRGSRLRPLTDRVPKALLPMLDIPLGGFALKRLLTISPSVIVNIDARARVPVEEGLRAVGAGRIDLMEESPEPYGAAGTLAAIRDRIGERIVTWNADALCDLEPSMLLGAHLASGAPATIAVVPVDSNADVEVGDGRATAFIDRHLRPDAPGAQFAGVAVLDAAVVRALPDARPLGLAEAVLVPLVRSGDLATYEHPGYALDVGTFERYVEGSVDLLGGRGPAPPEPWPGEIVAVPGGAAYLGPGARAAEGSLGPSAVILSGGQVAAGARVVRSVVSRDEVVPPGETLTNSVWPWFRGSGAPP